MFVNNKNDINNEQIRPNPNTTKSRITFTH